MTRFRELYGAGPLHLLAALACFGVAAYAVARVFALVGDPVRVLVWLGGGIVAHDLVLFPLYAAAGAGATALLVRGRGSSGAVVLNHLRVPALLSGLLLLVWFPLVTGKAPRTWERVAGLDNGVYLGRWAILSAALFAGSALVLALRATRSRRGRWLPQ